MPVARRLRADFVHRRRRAKSSRRCSCRHERHRLVRSDVHAGGAVLVGDELRRDHDPRHRRGAVEVEVHEASAFAARGHHPRRGSGATRTARPRSAGLDDDALTLGPPDVGRRIPVAVRAAGHATRPGFGRGLGGCVAPSPAGPSSRWTPRMPIRTCSSSRAIASWPSASADCSTRTPKAPTAIVDLQGTTLVPGLHRRPQPSVDLGAASALARRGRHHRARPTSSTRSGNRPSVNLIPPGCGVRASTCSRLPVTRADLDAAGLDRPVIVADYTLHQCVVSSAALEVLGIGRTTGDPPGGEYLRDADGRTHGRARRAGLEPRPRRVAARLLRPRSVGQPHRGAGPHPPRRRNHVPCTTPRARRRPKPSTRPWPAPERCPISVVGMPHPSRAADERPFRLASTAHRRARATSGSASVR